VTCSNKYTAKIIIGFPTFIGVAFLFLFVSANSANAIGIAEDINNLAERARLTTDTFMRETLPLRLRLEYGGEFTAKQDKQNLYELAKNASENLQTIAEIQQTLKNKIENYQGDDWDAKYGSTGLWRKLFAHLYTTILSKCQVDFYLALASNPSQRNNILSEILRRLDSLDTTYYSANLRFLKAKTMALLAQTQLVYKPSAMSQLDSLIAEPNIPQPIYFRAAVEKIKLVGQTRTGQLDSLVADIAQSNCTDDLELILSLAFLQRQLNYPEPLERIARLFPQAEDFLGSMILSDISYRIAQQQSLQQVSVFEAELAAQAVWSSDTEDYKKLLDQLSNTEKFQTPLILYVTAVKFAESSPAKAVNLLAKASRLQQTQKSNKLNVEAEIIAKQAVLLAYNLFIQNSIECQPALEAFENYYTIAEEKISGELGYLYGIVLSDCGQAEKAKGMLQKIADKSEGSWPSRAKLELIIQTIQQNQLINQDQRDKLLRQLSNLISQRSGQNETASEIRAEAINIYCQLLLESEDKTEAQKVLDILADTETARDPNLNVLKSKALRQLGRFDESAELLLRAYEPNNYHNALEAMMLLAEIIDQIEQLQQQTKDFQRLLKGCQRMAKYCEAAALSTSGYIPLRQSRLYLAEITILANAKQQEQLQAVEKLLGEMSKDGRADDVDLLRCRARLLAEQGRFTEAAQLWAKICEVRKAESPAQNQRSWKWWRAKYYQLDCLAKCPQTKKNQVLHTIEVLEASFTDIPALWAEKINLLKQTCRSQLIDASN